MYTYKNEIEPNSEQSATALNTELIQEKTELWSPREVLLQIEKTIQVECMGTL